MSRSFRLSLNRETLRHLTPDQATVIHGAGAAPTIKVELTSATSQIQLCSIGTGSLGNSQGCTSLGGACGGGSGSIQTSVIVMSIRH